MIQTGIILSVLSVQWKALLPPPGIGTVLFSERDAGTSGTHGLFYGYKNGSSAFQASEVVLESSCRRRL